MTAARAATRPSSVPCIPVLRMDIRGVDAPTWDRGRRGVEAIASREELAGTRATLRLW